MKIGLREVGVVLVLVAVAMAFLLVSFLNTLTEMSHESCSCGDTCEMERFNIPWVFYVGFISVLVVFFVGISMFAKGRVLYGEADSKGVWLDKLEGLEGDEKKLYKLIIDSGGALFQSELPEKTGLSKVKVTRTLDKLESLRLLERRRRGLTNIVVLKD